MEKANPSMSSFIGSIPDSQITLDKGSNDFEDLIEFHRLKENLKGFNGQAISFIEDSNDIMDLLTIINMSIQIDIQEQSELKEIMSILDNKCEKTQLKKWTRMSSARIHHPNPGKVSMNGRVLFTSTTQNSTKSSLSESNQIKSES